MLIFKVDFEKAFDLGDSLSPFLFILIMEGLRCAISNAKWRWRMYSFLNALWDKVGKALLGTEGGLDHQDKDCFIIDRIDNGQWNWNWSRADIGACDIAYLRDLVTETSHVDTNVDEDSLPPTLYSKERRFGGLFVIGVIFLFLILRQMSNKGIGYVRGMLQKRRFTVCPSSLLLFVGGFGGTALSSTDEEK
ncbi:hypothetical protein Tco_1405571 [Tanacetum coccineum]